MSLPPCGDPPVRGRPGLPNAGQGPDQAEWPKEGNDRRDLQIAFVPRIPSAGWLNDKHFPEHCGFIQARGPSMPGGRVGAIREGEAIEPVDGVKGTRRAPAHRAAAVNQHDQPRQSHALPAYHRHDVTSRLGRH